MALIACRECGKSVSNQALSCPHCGYPLKEDPVLDYAERRVRFGYVMAWIIMGLGGLLTVGAFVSGDLIALAVGCIGLGVLTLIANLVRDYMVRGSKVRPRDFSNRNS